MIVFKSPTLTNFCPSLSASVEARAKQAGDDKHPDQTPKKRLVGRPAIEDRAGDHRTEHPAPSVEQNHITADLDVMRSPEQIAGHGPTQWKSGFHGGKQDRKQAQRPERVGEDQILETDPLMRLYPPFV